MLTGLIDASSLGYEPGSFPKIDNKIERNEENQPVPQQQRQQFENTTWFLIMALFTSPNHFSIQKILYSCKSPTG